MLDSVILALMREFIPGIRLRDGKSSADRSRPVLLWWLAFVAAHLIYIPLIEEKGLERRFWKDYLEYKRRVPRWLVKRSDV